MTVDINLETSLKQIHNLLLQANEVLNQNPDLGIDRYDVPEMQTEYFIDSAFKHTLVLLDHLNLSRTYEQVNVLWDKAKKEGLTKKHSGINEHYLVWTFELYDYLEAIGNSYNIHPFSKIVSKDVISVLRATLYSITDKKIFNHPPKNEGEVHSRIEGVLKCIFPDLKHKPTIDKSIKSFIPDTGLKSVKTLIEYKFISNQDDAKRVCDEILADTRGYFNKDWEQSIYVIYETTRIKEEIIWNQLLKECGISRNTKVIVLSGEPVPKTTKPNK